MKEYMVNIRLEFVTVANPHKHEFGTIPSGVIITAHRLTGGIIDMGQVRFRFEDVNYTMPLEQFNMLVNCGLISQIGA